MPKLVKRERVPKDIANKILVLIARGHAIHTAAERSGIHRDTFYDWVKRGEKGEAGYKEFADKVRTAKSAALVDAFETVRQSYGAPRQGPGAMDWQSAAWFLERRDRATYGRPSNTIVTGPGGGPIPVVDVAKLSDDDLNKILDGKYDA